MLLIKPLKDVIIKLAMCLALCPVGGVGGGPLFAQVQQFGFSGGYSVLHNMNIGNGVAKATDPSAYLELGKATGSTKGFLGPRMTTTQRDAIASPATGLIIYNTTTNKINYWNGTAWIEIATPAVTSNSIDSLRRTGLIVYGRKNGVFIPQFTLDSAGGGGTVWGTITGTLSSQTDLQTALNARVRVADSAAMLNNYLRSLGNLSPLFTTSSTSHVGSFIMTNASPYTVLGRGSGTGAYSFLSSLDSNWIPGLHTQSYYDARYLQNIGGGGGALVFSTGLLQTGNNVVALKDAAIWNAVSLQSHEMSSATPTNGQTIVFNSATNKWELETGGKCGLLNGTGIVTWDSVLHFSVSAAIWNSCLDGTRYTSNATTITLDPADLTNPRIDAIVLQDGVGLTKITGTPASSPSSPQLGADQILLTYVTVNTAATTPSGIITTTIYDENTGAPEWNGSATSVTTNFAQTAQFYHLTKSTDAGAVTASSVIKYTAPSFVRISKYSTLRFFVKLKAAFANTCRFQLSWLHGTQTVSSTVTVGQGLYGFLRSLGDWQEIVVPMSDFTFSSDSVDVFKIQMSGNNSSGFYLDWIQIQGGLQQGPARFRFGVSGEDAIATQHRYFTGKGIYTFWMDSIPSYTLTTPSLRIKDLSENDYIRYNTSEFLLDTRSTSIPLNINNLPISDTATYVLGINTVNRVVRQTKAAATWDAVLAAGGQFTANRSVNANRKNFLFDSIGYAQLSAGSGSAISLIGIDSTQTFIQTNHPNLRNIVSTGAYSTVAVSALTGYNTSSTKGTAVLSYADSLLLGPTTSGDNALDYTKPRIKIMKDSLMIHSLPASSSTDEYVRRNATTGKITSGAVTGVVHRLFKTTNASCRSTVGYLGGTYNYNLVAGQLAAQGESIDVWYNGTVNNSGGADTLFINFASTGVAFTLNFTGAWEAHVRYFYDSGIATNANILYTMTIVMNGQSPLISIGTISGINTTTSLGTSINMYSSGGGSQVCGNSATIDYWPSQ